MTEVGHGDAPLGHDSRTTPVEGDSVSSVRLAPPPGPRGLDVLRFFGGGSFAAMLGYFEEVARRHGPIASFRILGRRLHLVTGPELVREVLVAQQHRFTRANGTAVLRDLLGEGMLRSSFRRNIQARSGHSGGFFAATGWR